MGCVDVAVGFSFGGVVSVLSIFRMTWLLVCFSGLLDLAVCFFDSFTISFETTKGRG